MKTRWPGSIALRRLGRLIAALLLIASTGLPWVAAAQDVTGPVEFYRSEEFGYFLWWNTDEWEVLIEEVEPGSDHLRLSDRASVTDIWGYAEPGVSAESCLRDAVDAIQSDPTLVRYEALSAPGADPELTLDDDGSDASTSLVLGFDDPNGRLTFAAEERCTTLIPGQQMLYTSNWADAERYNGWGGTMPPNSPLSALTLPRGVFGVAPAATSVEGPGGIAALPMIGADGVEQGILTQQRTSCPLPTLNMTVVAAQATGPGNWVIAPGAFVLIDEAGVESAPASVRWLWPPIAANDSAALHEGEVALLELTYHDMGLLHVVDSNGTRSSLEGLGSFYAFHCSQGGGGAPIVVDIE